MGQPISEPPGRWDDSLSEIRKVIDPPGTKIRQGMRLNSRYCIEKKLGAGGMGRVYKALDLQSQRMVAIKQIVALSGMDSVEVAERLKREYYFLNGIDHRNLVKAYDFFAQGNDFFLVLEFLDGVSLQEFIATFPARLPLQEQLAIANQVSRAVDILNTAGIIHRDIKPGNIIINRERGEVKLLDLGLGKSLNNDLATITQSGSIVGTVEYLSPEQVNGGISERSDIFSLGITLYQLFTWDKKSAFKTHSTVATMMNILSKPLPPMAQNLGITVSPEYQHIYSTISLLLEKALAKKPEDRLAGAGIMADEFAKLYRTLAAPASTREPMVTAEFGIGKKLWALSAPIDAELLQKLQTVHLQCGGDRIQQEKRPASETNDERNYPKKSLRRTSRFLRKSKQRHSPKRTVLLVLYIVLALLIVWGTMELLARQSKRDTPTSDNNANPPPKLAMDHKWKSIPLSSSSLEEIFINYSFANYVPATIQLRPHDIIIMTRHQARMYYLYDGQAKITLEMSSDKYIANGSPYGVCIYSVKDLANIGQHDHIHYVQLQTWLSADMARLLRDSLPSLKILQIWWGESGDLTYLPQLYNLIAVDLHRLSISGTGLANLARMHNLQMLNLGESSINDDHLIYLSKLSQLKSLNLDTTKIGNSGIHWLNNLKQLQVLNLAETKISDRGLQVIANLNSLQILNLNATKVSASGIANLARLSHLEALYLAGIHIGDNGLRQIAEFSNLRLLSVPGTDISNKGLAHLIKLSKLRSLNISETAITDQAITQLQQMKNLHFLNLNWTKISNDGVRQLKESLPDCHIVK